MSTVINCVEYEAGKRRAEVDLKEACPCEAAGNFVWVGLHEPNEELLRTVQQRFDLHDLAIEDALLAHQRPKLEIYGDSIFMALRTAQLVDRKIQFGETHIFAGRGYVVTVRHGSTTAYREVRARCEGVPEACWRRGRASSSIRSSTSSSTTTFRFCTTWRPKPTRWRRKCSRIAATRPTSSASTSCATNCCCCAAPCSRCRRCATASCASTCR